MATPAALYLQDAHPIREGMDIVRYAEERGLDAVWQADSRLVRDAVVPMAAFAAVTEHIRIGSGVVDCWTRNPARLASTFSTLDDLAPGRVVLGIGAWWDPLAEKVGISSHRLVYQSRSGNPRDPWLVPDVLDALDEEAERGARELVVAPIGFVCDHVEVLYDLDIEAQRKASALGVRLTRAATLGTHPAFLAALADAVIRTAESA